MSTTLRLLAAGLVALSALPTLAGERDKSLVTCSVAIDYALNNGTPESFRQDFTVSPSQPFVNDFSTPLRQKEFRASAAPEGSNIAVTIDYFNDAGVFHSVGFNTRLSVRQGRAIETTAGSNSFSTSLGVAGNHRTSYTLTCRRLG